ncbi:hypothetical protein BSKO_02659 [Bryopsis sp. KO-2023]|nr:hypothetical protein BSKO_02659 [Bryopsis sp. KO-2023]
MMRLAIVLALAVGAFAGGCVIQEEYGCVRKSAVRCGDDWCQGHCAVSFEKTCAKKVWFKTVCEREDYCKKIETPCGHDGTDVDGLTCGSSEECVSDRVCKLIPARRKKSYIGWESKPKAGGLFEVCKDVYSCAAVDPWDLEVEELDIVCTKEYEIVKETDCISLWNDKKLWGGIAISESKFYKMNAGFSCGEKLVGRLVCVEADAQFKVQKCGDDICDVGYECATRETCSEIAVKKPICGRRPVFSCLNSVAPATLCGNQVCSSIARCEIIAKKVCPDTTPPPTTASPPPTTTTSPPPATASPPPFTISRPPPPTTVSPPPSTTSPPPTTTSPPPATSSPPPSTTSPPPTATSPPPTTTSPPPSTTSPPPSTTSPPPTTTSPPPSTISPPPSTTSPPPSTTSPPPSTTSPPPATSSPPPSTTSPPPATTSPPPSTTSPPPATTTSPPPATTSPPPATTSPPPATTTSPPPATTTSPPPATTTSPPPATTTSPPPATTTSPPPATTTSPPPATTTSPPPATTTSPPPTTNPSPPPRVGLFTRGPPTPKSTSGVPGATVRSTSAADQLGTVAITDVVANGDTVASGDSSATKGTTFSDSRSESSLGVSRSVTDVNTDSGSTDVAEATARGASFQANTLTTDIPLASTYSFGLSDEVGPLSDTDATAIGTGAAASRAFSTRGNSVADSTSDVLDGVASVATIATTDPNTDDVSEANATSEFGR